MLYILFWKSQVYLKKGTLTILLYSESTMVQGKKYETPTSDKMAQGDDKPTNSLSHWYQW